MPESPACSVRSSSSNCRFGSFFGAIRYWMLGRSKLATNWRRLGQAQPGYDLGAGGLGRGGGQCDERHLAEPLAQHGQAEVVGAEIVPPLGYAVRLVDGEQRDPAALEQPQRRLGAQPLRCHVQQVELTGDKGVLDQAAGADVLGGIEEAGPDTESAQRVHLILHERDQGRDHHPGPVPDQGRDLVAQRLAAAGGHQHQRVLAADQVIDDLLLAATEGVVAENPAQHLRGVAQTGTGAGGGHLSHSRRIPGRDEGRSPARQVHHRSPPVST